MFEYISIFLLFIFLSYNYDIKGNKAGYNTWVKFCCVILILLAGLRNHVGGDTFNYIYHFDQWPNLQELFSTKLSLSEVTQPLWFLINCILKTIYSDFVVVQLFHAIVVNLLIFRFIKKTTNKVFIAILFVYCIVWWNFNFEIMRESLCVAIYLNSLLELKNKKVFRFILFSIPCLLIHYFSFVIIAFTLLVYYLNNKTTILLIGAIILVLLVFRDIFSNFALEIASMTAEDLSERLEDYIYGDVYGTTNLNLFGVFSKLLLLLQPVLIIYSYYTSKTTDSLELKLLMLYILFFIITAVFPIFSRFLNYLMVLLIIGSINYLSQNKRKRNLSYSIVCILFIYNMVAGINEFYTPSPSDRSNNKYDCRYIPYKNVFEMPDATRESLYGK